MRMMVCVKQVPDTEDVRMDEQGHLVRTGTDSMLNPYCEFALEAALSLRKEGDSVEVVTMGPQSARSVLLRCLERGADKAYLISGRDFAGSDTWATARTLSAFMEPRMEEECLILCGKQAVDGDTGQVPAELAEFLGLPHYYHCTDAWRENDEVCLIQDYGAHRRRVRLKGPAVVAVSRSIGGRRIPSVTDLRRARRMTIDELGREDLDLSPDECGSRGSLTRVKNVIWISHGRDGKILTVVPEKAAEAALRKGGFI